MDTFETYISSEKQRLAQAKAEARAALKETQAKLDALETELSAIAAYEAAKKGKAAGEKKTRRPRQTGKRKEILTLVQAYPAGVTAGELKDKLAIRGDKSAEQSLSNALAALKKSGHLTLQDGTYRAA